MNRKKLDQKNDKLTIAVKNVMAEFANTLTGKQAIVPRGKYKGRKALIAGFTFTPRSGIGVLLYPYRLDQPDQFVDNHSPDARTYWPFQEVELCQ